MSQNSQHRGRPLADRLALAAEDLEEFLPRLLDTYELREDHLAQLLADQLDWYGDSEFVTAPPDPAFSLPVRKGGAA